MVESIWQDLKHGTRMLAKNPGFAFVAIASIAIGVGANAAMFSVADGLVLRPVQAPRASEIVSVNAITSRASERFVTNRLISYPDYRDLRDRTESFAGVFASRVTVQSVAVDRDQPAQSMVGLVVSGNFFDVLQLQPALGRFFRPDEDRVPGRDAVIVLAHETWVNQFGSDRAVVGRQIRLGGIDFTVIGVAPESFAGLQLALPPAYYVPIAISPSLAGSLSVMLEERTARALDVRGRLLPGVSLEQARQDLALIASSLEQTYPDTNRNVGLTAQTAFDARLEERGASAPSAFLLVALAFVVLLVACANVAGLLVSRAPVREREIALRLAIGGGRLRVTRQLITESCLLAVGGGALGLLIGYGVLAVFRQLPLVSDIGVRLTFELDRRAVAVGAVLAALSALLSSVVPAWRATRTGDLSSTLRAGGSRLQRLSGLWGRNGLVTGQVALSLVLVAVSVFLARAFDTELDRPGFRTTRILLTNFEPQLARYDTPRTELFYSRVKEQIRSLPGVTSVGMTSVMPLNQDYRDPVSIVPEGFQLPSGIDRLVVLSARIDDGYLDAMAVPLLEGRGISASDSPDTPRVVVVNQAMAARYWPGESPVGKRVRLMDSEGQPWAEVVGMAADNKNNWIGEAPTPWMYMAQRQDLGSRSTLVIASDGDAAALASPVREIVREIDPNMPLSGMRTMEEFYYGNAAGVVLGLTRITGAMGLLGVLLAMVGLYGLVAYAAARRTREIGIRMAVGAQSQSVLRMILRHGVTLSLSGAAVGVIVSIGVSGLLRSVFPSAGPIDLQTYLTVVPLLIAVTIMAALIPARRASRIDPLVALRQD